MNPRDVCGKCGGFMKTVNKVTMLPIDCVCKDTHGWDPRAWAKERARLEKAGKPPGGGK